MGQQLDGGKDVDKDVIRIVANRIMRNGLYLVPAGCSQAAV